MAETSIYRAPESQDQNTLEAAKKWLLEEAKTSGGAQCPCCDEKQKARGCKLTPDQAAMLVIMYNNYPVGAVVCAMEVAVAVCRRKGDGTFVSDRGLERMVHWDLLENTDVEGDYTLCDGGALFVHKGFPITPRAWLLGNKVIGRDGKPTKLVKILADKFDLNDLLAIHL